MVYMKAYDKIPRSELFQILTQFRCGHKMLRAIANTYGDTSSIFGAIIIDAIIGLNKAKLI